MPFAKDLVHYDTVELGIVALTRTIASEYEENIRANVVVPGGIETERVKKLEKEAIMKFDFRRIPTFFNFNARASDGTPWQALWSSESNTFPCKRLSELSQRNRYSS